MVPFYIVTATPTQLKYIHNNIYNQKRLNNCVINVITRYLFFDITYFGENDKNNGFIPINSYLNITNTLEFIVYMKE
ncbi:hypothetical protein bcgnr5369_23710 [Bacillus cereus]